MAITELQYKQHKYIGLSTDSKPTNALNGCTAGSTFYEYDTKRMFVTYNGTNWVIKENFSSVSDNRKVVTTAATAVALVGSSTRANWIIITAETDNTGIIVIGGSTVVAALATRRGIPLSSGESVVLMIDDVADVYEDSTVNGDGVTFTYGY